MSSPEWSGAAAGSAGGAAKGAAVGAQIAGPYGALAGAAIGGTIGGASGYLGGKGAKKRKKKQEQARNRYMSALQQYEGTRQKNLEGQMADAEAGFASQQKIDDDYYRNMVGDRSQAFAADEQNALAALTNVGPQSTLSGPLGAGYQAEMAARNQVALRPMATSQALLSQAAAQDEVEQARAMRSAALMPDALYKSQLRGLSNIQNEQAMDRAANAYGVQRVRADNAGAEHMMYGALLNQLIQMGGQAGDSYIKNRDDDRDHAELVAAMKAGRK